MSILTWVLEHKWAITTTALEAIIGVLEKDEFVNGEMLAKAIHGAAWERYLDAEGNPVRYDALEANNYPILDGTRRVSQADDVAILPVVGPIFPRANLMTMSGGVSLQSVSYDFNTAMESEEIKKIILSFDTPGGEITGISEFSEMVYKARELKKIVAYVYGLGASAGYWMASAASEIVIGDTAEVGSIGVVAGYTSFKKQDEKRGVERIEIVSSQSPHKRPDPTTNAGRAQIQEAVDTLADVFIGAVARQRGVDKETVLANYGQGRLFIGQDAVDKGLADRVGSLEGLVDEFKASVPQPTFYLGGSMDLAELQAKHPALYAQVTENAKAAALKDVDTKVATAKAEGISEENARIKAIEEIDDADTAAVVKEHKFDTKETAETIAAKVLAAQKAKREAIGKALGEDGEKLGDTLAGVGDRKPVEGTDAARKTVVNAAVSALNMNRK